MIDEWENRVRKELKELQKNCRGYDGQHLPYYVEMKECLFTPNIGKCEVSFLVSLDDDIGEDGGKMTLQRANSSRVVIFTVDASLQAKQGTIIPDQAISYPMHEPKITLSCGAGYFPQQSKINNNDILKFDESRSWQSNIYLFDVALNMASLIRRSIRSGNMCFLVEKKEEAMNTQSENPEKKSALIRLRELRGYLKRAQVKGVEESKNNLDDEAKRNQLMELRSMIKNKGVEEERETAKAIESFEDESSFEDDDDIGQSLVTSKEKKKGFSTRSIKGELDINIIEEGVETDNDSLSTKGKSRSSNDKKSCGKEDVQTTKYMMNHVSETREVDKMSVGDVVNLNQFDNLRGQFKCTLIKRPEFVKSILTAEQIKKNYMKSVTSRRNPIFKDLYIGLFDDKIVEMKRPSDTFLFSNKAKITFVIPLLSLLKIEYSTKKGTISLFFKQDLKHPIVYSSSHCEEAAKLIQNVMREFGVAAKHRTPEMESARKLGLKLCQDIKTKQKAIGDNPSMDEVREIIDLHCLAAEKLAFARDERHADVILHMNKFIGKTKISRVLTAESESIKSDVSYKSSGNTESVSTQGQHSYQSLDELLHSDNSIDNVENEGVNYQKELNTSQKLRPEKQIKKLSPEIPIHKSMSESESLVERVKRRIPLQRYVIT